MTNYFEIFDTIFSKKRQTSQTEEYFKEIMLRCSEQRQHHRRRHRSVVINGQCFRSRLAQANIWERISLVCNVFRLCVKLNHCRYSSLAHKNIIYDNRVYSEKYLYISKKVLNSRKLSFEEMKTKRHNFGEHHSYSIITKSIFSINVCSGLTSNQLYFGFCANHLPIQHNFKSSSVSSSFKHFILVLIFEKETKHVCLWIDRCEFE